MSGFTGPDNRDKQTSWMVDTIEKLGPEDTGRFLQADAQDFPRLVESQFFHHSSPTVLSRTVVKNGLICGMDLQDDEHTANAR